MSALLLVGLCLAAGYLARSVLNPAALSSYVLTIALPAVALGKLHKLETMPWVGVGTVWLVFLVAWGLFSIGGRMLGASRATVACLVLLAGLSNTSFVGFPLIEVLVGPQAIHHAVPIDQLGSFVLSCTLAPVVIARAHAERLDLRAMLLPILRFPGFWATLLSLALRGQPIPEVVDLTLDRIGATLSPVALVAVGAQLTRPRAGDLLPMSAGLGFKLLLAPALALLLMTLTRQPRDEAFRVAVLENAMAPMMTAAMMATQAKLRPDLAQTMVAVGVPLSLLTVWWWSTVV